MKHLTPFLCLIVTLKLYSSGVRIQKSQDDGNPSIESISGSMKDYLKDQNISYTNKIKFVAAVEDKYKSLKQQYDIDLSLEKIVFERMLRGGIKIEFTESSPKKFKENNNYFYDNVLRESALILEGIDEEDESDLNDEEQEILNKEKAYAGSNLRFLLNKMDKDVGDDLKDEYDFKEASDERDLVEKFIISKSPEDKFPKKEFLDENEKKYILEYFYGKNGEIYEPVGILGAGLHGAVFRYKKITIMGEEYVAVKTNKDGKLKAESDFLRKLNDQEGSKKIVLQHRGFIGGKEGETEFQRSDKLIIEELAGDMYEYLGNANNEFSDKIKFIVAAEKKYEELKELISNNNIDREAIHGDLNIGNIAYRRKNDGKIEIVFIDIPPRPIRGEEDFTDDIIKEGILDERDLLKLGGDNEDKDREILNSLLKDTETESMDGEGYDFKEKGSYLDKSMNDGASRGSILIIDFVEEDPEKRGLFK